MPELKSVGYREVTRCKDPLKVVDDAIVVFTTAVSVCTPEEMSYMSDGAACVCVKEK